MKGTLVLSAGMEGLFEVAADRIAAALAADGKHRDTINVALAGGKSPKGLYECLAREPWSGWIPWEKIHLFWGDERVVPHNHPDSNYQMVQKTLLDHVPLPPEQVHPVPTTLRAEKAAREYEKTLRSHFHTRWGVPTFDLILLGLGADGHIASLFPWTPALEEQKQLVTVAHGISGTARVSLTMPVINQARRVYFLITGKSKAKAVQQALEAEGRMPAQRVALSKGELVWLVDQPAASGLTQVQVLS